MLFSWRACRSGLNEAVCRTLPRHCESILRGDLYKHKLPPARYEHHVSPYSCQCLLASLFKNLNHSSLYVTGFHSQLNLSFICLMAIRRSYFVKHLLKSCVLFINWVLSVFKNIYIPRYKYFARYILKLFSQSVAFFFMLFKSFYMWIYKYFQLRHSDRLAFKTKN